MLNSALSFGHIFLFFFVPLLRVLNRKWNGCFVLNLLQAREFLPSPIFSYFAFIIIISIQRGLAHILLSPTPLLCLQSSFPFLRRLSFSFSSSLSIQLPALALISFSYTLPLVNVQLTIFQTLIVPLSLFTPSFLIQ